MMNAQTAKVLKVRKATASARLPRRRCLACRFCAPSGQCRDSTIRSGRCGDWVYYVTRSNRQGRRLWVKPRDPRTPNQRHWRARLGAASRKYSASLTDEQQDACIAAGAKRRCRPRLGPSGVLTGQQYWVRQVCRRKAEERTQNAATAVEGLQTLGISLPTWEPHRGVAGMAPGHHRRNTGPASGSQGRRRDEPCGSADQNGSARPLRTPYSALRTQRHHRSRKKQVVRNAVCRVRNGRGERCRWSRPSRELRRGS